MALIKISSLSTLASAGDTDVFPIVSGGTTYKITKLAFLAQIQSDVDGKLVKSSNLSDLTNASTARTNLGLGTLATQSGTFSGTHSGNSSGTNTGDQDLSSYAPLASPTFTGTPAGPTAAIDTNTTQLATTAWVINQGYQKLAGATTAVASGSLSTGNKVILNSDGTVSVITGVAYSAGSSTTATSASTIGSVHSMYDTVSSRVVICYQKNSGTSGDPECVIGTVTGSSISFGTPVAIPTGGFTNNIAICKTGIGSSKIIVASCNYNVSQQGQIVVGTISGTSISFGSSVAFNAGVATNNISIDWDSTNSKAILLYDSASTAIKASVVTVSGTVPTVNTAVTIASVANTQSRVVWTGTSNVFVCTYADTTNSVGKSGVLTVSGTTLSAGTLANFDALNVNGSISLAWDSNSGKAVVAYQKVSDTSGWCAIGTVSGTNISWGTPVNFATGNITGIGVAYDSTNFKVQIAYYDATNGKAIEGTVSGTSITFGTATTTTATNSSYTDSISYVGSSYFCHVSLNGGVLKAQVVKSFYTNLTSTNFLGISTSNYTNGQTATIAVLGGTDANQSGLTAGVKYYVNDDGTLGTTSTQPFVGLGLTSTRILIKG